MVHLLHLFEFAPYNNINNNNINNHCPPSTLQQP